MNKKAWITTGLVLCSIVALLVSVYFYKLLSTPSAPTSTVQDGAATTKVTSTTISTTVPTSDTTHTTDSTTNTIPATAATSDNTPREFSWSKAQEQQIAAMLEEYGGTVAVLYEDLSSGYVYSYNADTVFSAASLIKAPYCMYVLQLASEGKCDLTQQVTYTEKIKSDGTGIIKNEEFGTSFTVQQLLEYAIRYSDNAALRMLRSVYPVEGFKEFAASIGIENVNAIANATSAKITAKDAATYMRAIDTFIRENEVYGQLLRKYMTTTRNPMLTSSYDVIRKYGWAEEAFHDMAIVDAPQPYILVFLTDHAEGTKEDFAMFRKLSRTVENFSQQPA